jgi:hypothetical protein
MNITNSGIGKVDSGSGAGGNLSNAKMAIKYSKNINFY